MSKKNKNNSLHLTRKEIEKQRRAIEKQERLIRSQCTHTKHNGSLALELYSGTSEGRCTICGEEFNVAPISMAELQKSIQVVHNAIQQCRIFGDGSDDKKLVTLLGETDYNVTNIVHALYKQVSTEYMRSNNKGKKKPKKQQNSFGSYSNGRFSTL